MSIKSQAELMKERMIAQIKARQLSAQAKITQASIAEQVKMAHIPLAAKPQAPDLGELDKPLSAAKTEIVLNERQELAVRYGLEGKEFCLIGAAGTGKTTTVRTLVQKLLAQTRIELGLSDDAPIPYGYIACVAFTRRAVRNIAKALKPIGADKYCRTAHAQLEYAPNYDGYYDKEGNWKSSMRFIPQRTESNPIKECKLVIIDESSMLSYDGLYRELKAAHPNATFIFIGDLNQLPPVFGDAVLGFKLAQLPVVELTEVYRQAMESPIIWFQHNFTLKGKVPASFILEKLTKESTPEKGLEFHKFKQNHDDGDVMSQGVAHLMLTRLDEGVYDPEQDTILIPFNKSFGSININLHIAEGLAIRKELVVHEIVANYKKSYYAVGDFVMYEKKECVITSIEKNPKYMGIVYQEASKDLSRFGYIRIGGKAPKINLDFHEDFVALTADEILNMTAETEEKMLAASHKIYLRETEGDQEYILETTGDVNALDYGYCMTVHKSQGSEWRKVWLVLHRMHANMLSREMLYTGMTRAREKLTILYTGPTASGRTDSTISKSIKKAVLKGTHWRDKVQEFKGKFQQGDFYWDVPNRKDDCFQSPWEG